MKTNEVAKILGYTPNYVRQLIGERKLKATRNGPRLFNVDSQSVKDFLRRREGDQAEEPAEKDGKASSEEATLAGSGSSHVPAAETRADSEVAAAIAELEADSIVVAGEPVSIAQLFWALSQFYLDGLEPVSVFPTLMQALPECNPGDRAAAANEALRKLTFHLSTLQLVAHENRQSLRGGYTVIVCTPLGAKVIRSLQSKGWTRL